MAWPGKLLVTYDNFTADLPALRIDKKTEGCTGSCICKCKCCRGFREKYVAFNGENALASEISNEFSDGDVVQKMMRFRSSDMLLLLHAAQLRDNFWTNHYFKADLHEDYQAILNVFKDKNRKVHLETVAAIMDTVSTGYRRAVSQLEGQEAQGALRPKFAALTLPGLRCVCPKCELLPWKKLQDVEDHQRTHRYSDNFHCQICYRRFYLQHSVTAHISRQMGSNSEELYENERYKRLLEKLRSGEQAELQIAPVKVEDVVLPALKNPKLYFKEESKPPIQRRKTSTHAHCPLCYKKYGFSFSHQLHMLKHRRNGPEQMLFPCAYCHKSFLTLKFLRKHLNRVRISSILRYRPYKCGSCPRRFQLWSTLKTHINQVHKRINTCLICQLPTLARCCSAHCAKECREAIKNHREKQRLLRGPPKAGCKKKPKPVCTVCGSEFENNFFLREHLNRKHLNKRNFTCEICGANFYSQGTMQTHRKSVHLLSQTVKCEVCELTIKSRRNYLRHLKSQSHKDNWLKLGKSAIKSTEDNHHNGTSTEHSAINNERTVAAQDGQENKSETPCRFQMPVKVTFCEACGNSIIGSMRRHCKSTKHRLNLVVYNKKFNKHI
ncbi:zinc finger and BTB domain-containing protein 41 [Drosophila biarmipes]|uniref:zinc finger and BTB domain-containing protein 41 n=1 Tax=Drosophila biarmipes TaxID=125945 RepID=UPI0007E5DEF2|nr:zinc finger and BTB domain-containing protein 41 [Drosophila biarmipes]